MEVRKLLAFILQTASMVNTYNLVPAIILEIHQVGG